MIMAVTALCRQRHNKVDCIKYFLNIFSESSDVTFCGNGKLEEDEECDAGYYGDDCCDKNCKLKPGAICRYVVTIVML